MNYKIIFTAFVVSIYLTNCSNQENNKKPNNFVVDSLNKSSIKQNEDFTKITGHWCFNVRDSLNFEINLIFKNDSLYGTYSCVLFGGKYLNTTDEDSDWAFKIKAINIFDSTNIIDGKNYSNDEPIKIKLFYNATNRILSWIELDKDLIKKDELPTKALMHKCKS